MVSELRWFQSTAQDVLEKNDTINLGVGATYSETIAMNNPRQFATDIPRRN